MNLLRLTLTALLLAPAAFSQASNSDTTDVQHVVNAFHEAVLTHDGPRLSALFLPQGSTWVNVLSDAAYARAIAKNPATPKVRVTTFKDFANLISTSKASFNPTHTHLQILGNGTIAAVYFDYIFLIDGKEQNRGNETWQLVKGADGWRIAAITYSSDPQV